MKRSSAAFVLVCAAGVACAEPRAGAGADRSAAAGASDGGAERARVTLAQDLPALDGTSLAVSVVEVTYGPGESTPPHRHLCPVIGYVADGALRFQVAGQAESVYRAGDSFYEAPNSEHVVSANASESEPVTFVALFICDREGPRTVSIEGSQP